MKIGLVVHPTRDVDEPLRALRRCASASGAELVQVAGDEREVAPPGAAGDCTLVVAIGGDGTTLNAIRIAAEVERPVLGIACGSLGVLTTVAADGIARALARFGDGDWTPRRLPALAAERDGGESLVAFNDIVAIRAGEGQVRSTAHVDDVLFSRIAGDGCIVSTAVGSSAYALAAGGPLVAPGADAFLLTPLSAHGGSCPPLVIGGRSRLQLSVTAGHGGLRIEVDGQQMSAEPAAAFTVTLRRDAVTVVGFSDQEPLIAGLRRRQIIADSPRILAEERRG